jgi:hypothetical protein
MEDDRLIFQVDCGALPKRKPNRHVNCSHRRYIGYLYRGSFDGQRAELAPSSALEISIRWRDKSQNKSINKARRLQQLEVIFQCELEKA